MNTYTSEQLAAAAIAAQAALRSGQGSLEDLPAVHGRPSGRSGGSRAVTPGAGLVDSDAYKAWLERFPGGGPTARGTFQSDPVHVPGGFRALVTSADASAGSLVPPDFRGLLEPGTIRTLTLRQLVTVLTTDSDRVDYSREAGRISAAAPVAEATGIDNTTKSAIGGLKPEAGVQFEAAIADVRTFAAWIPATRRIVADANQLRSYLDAVLRDDLGLELEDQMIGGSGTGENFLGILNEPDIGTAGPPGVGESQLHVLRRGIRQVRVDGRAVPNACVMNPVDAESIDLLQVNSEENHFAGAGPYGALQRIVWGVPVVESEAVPVGTAVVGDFRRAVLFDREQANVSLGTVNDDFLRNVVRILAEMRAAFAVLRPKAFCAVDLGTGA
jgi:HK97 family phage major capsid protein